LLDRIDQALGDLPEMLTAYRPQPVLSSRIHFGAPTTRVDVLTEAIHRALERFCETLSRQVVGVRQMFVTFCCPDVVTEQGSQMRTVTLPVDLSQPTRSAKHLGSLLMVVLERLHLPAPADSLVLWAREADPLDDWQDELFTTGSSDAHKLDDLLDRLAVRLGPQTVVRPELVSEHQPERAFRYVPLVGAGGTSPQRLKNEAVPSGPRPLRLSPRPIEVSATAIVPDGPPIAFRLRGTRHAVAESVGPERIETGWWRGPHLKRDYYRVTTEKGRRFWLFRERNTRRWFLHGWFD
jgi:protein ImuB